MSAQAPNLFDGLMHHQTGLDITEHDVDSDGAVTCSVSAPCPASVSRRACRASFH